MPTARAGLIIVPSGKGEKVRTPATHQPTAAVTHTATAQPQKTPIPNAPQAAAITATNRDSFPNHGDGKAHQGDTITYSVAVTNTGDANATGVNYTDTVDQNTSTLVGGSPTIQFTVAGDTYSAIGNVKIDTSTIAPGSGQTVLENDTTNSATLTGFGSTLANANGTVPNGTNTVTTTNGGTVAMSASGSFTYNPAAGFGGAGVTDTFWYTLTKNTIGTGNPTGFPSGAARVTINVSSPIWFVNQAAAGGGNGTLTTPFNCLTGVGCFSAVNDGVGSHPKAGDFIFLYKNPTPPAAFTGGLTLLNNQKLIGEGATASLATIAGVALPPGSDPLPTTGNAPPVITTVAAATNGINIGVGNSNTLRGFNIGNTTGSKIASGASFGTLTVTEMTLSGTGPALNLTSGALAATFANITSTSAAGAAGISLATISGSLTVSGTTAISNTGNEGIKITGSSLTANFGTTNITTPGLSSISISSTTGNITFGATTLTNGIEGVDLNGNSAGTRTFGSLSITGVTANAFNHSNNGAIGGGNVTVTGATTISCAGNAISVSAPASGNLLDFQGATSATVTAAGPTGVNWAGAAGATMQFNALTIQTNGGIGLNATTGGTINVTNGTGTINNTTQAASAIVANGIALNANFSAIKSSGGGSGVSLTAVTGTSNFGGGALSGAIAATFLVFGGTASVTYGGGITQATATQPMVSITNHATGTITFNTGTLSATNGTGIQFDNADGTYNFNGTNTLNGGDAGIDIQNGSAGTFLFSSNTSITNPSGIAYREDTSTANVTYNGTISKTNNANSAVSINAKTGGTTAFSGAITGTTTTANAINLTNTGGIVNFTGGLNLTTTSGVGFNASGSGATISATQNNTTIVNTLTTTTGTALNVANTTIGASNLTFRSINSPTASGNAGIVLNTTGASGGLVVTGNASAGTGGTISNKTVDAVSLTSTSNVSLSFMNVNTNSHKGIVGTSVNGFTLISSTLSGNGSTDATNDNGVRLIDTTGAVTLTTDTVTGSFATNLWISTTSSSTAAITTLTITNGSYNSSVQSDGVLISLSNTSSIATGSITGVTFSGNASMSLNPVANDNSTMGNGVGAPATGTLTIANCTFTNSGGLGVSFASGGGNGASTQYVRFVGNVMTGTHSFAINVVSGATSTGGTQKVLIDNNCIGMSGAATGTAPGHCGVTPGPPDSGSKLGEGIQVTQQGKTLGTVTITNNFIRNLSNGAGEFGNRVVDVQTLGPSPAQGASPIPFDIKIVGNNLDSGFTGSFPQAAIYLGVDDQSGTPTTMHAEVHGNTVPVGPGCEGVSCGASTGMIIYDRVTSPSTGTLYQCSGAGNPCGGAANANVSTELANTNTGTAGKTCAVDLVNLTLTGTAPATVARLSVPIGAPIETVSAAASAGQTVASQLLQANVPSYDSSATLTKKPVNADMHAVARSVRADKQEMKNELGHLAFASTATNKLRNSAANGTQTQAAGSMAAVTPVRAGLIMLVSNPTRTVRSNHAVRRAVIADQKPLSPQSGGSVNLALGTITPGSTVVLTYQATVNNTAPSGASQISNQGTVTSSAPTVVTDDPDTVTANDATITPLLHPTAANGTVSGRITDTNGNAVEGAVVTLSGGQSRKFITDANGNYQFDNVDTGGFYTVTPTRSNFNFNPFNRSFSQTGNKTEAAFNGTSMGDNANPLDTPEYFVRQQYVDVLRREPDESGFNYWSDQILACGEDASCTRAKRTSVAAAFFIENEAQITGSFIYDVYAGALGRRPAFTEYSVDRQQVIGGDTLDTAKTVFAQNFVQRAEFMTKFQNAITPESFVDALILSVQSSGGDLSGERSNLIGIYNQAGDLVTSRAAVVRSLADNATFKQSQYTKAFVLTEYFSYLQRDAEPDGYSFWVNVLNNGDPGNYRGMVCSFVTSEEYQNRFSAVVSHGNGECGR